MLYSEIIAVCSQIHAKHINTLCGQNVELVGVEPSDYWTLRIELTLEIKFETKFLPQIRIQRFARKPWGKDTTWKT